MTGFGRKADIDWGAAGLLQLRPSSIYSLLGNRLFRRAALLSGSAGRICLRPLWGSVMSDRFAGLGTNLRRSAGQDRFCRCGH